MRILIDSSTFIHWLRMRENLHWRLAGWLRSGDLVGCGVVRAEVLRVVIDARQRDRIAEFFQLFPEVPTDVNLWAEVAELAWTLDRQGLILPLSDIVIGCCARRAGAALITSDSHFQHIPKLQILSDLPFTDTTT